MAKKKKYYVVWNGRIPGIYDSWDACKKQIDHYPKAKYKSFATKQQAEAAFNQGYSASSKIHIEGPIIDHIENPDIVTDSWCVDAACAGNPGKMEYRGVDLMTGKELFRKGPYLGGTNNIGEYLAIVHALALLNKLGLREKTIYTDSITAMSWIRKKIPNTKLKRSKQNEFLFVLMERGMRWLNTHSYSHHILKWDTKNWGEIPADFGRK